MIRTKMDHQDGGHYTAQLFDDDLLIAETTESLSWSQAMRWLGRASADYVLAQANVARHSEGPI